MRALWLVDNESHHTLRQFSTGGTLLNTVTTATDYSGNVYGAQFVPGQGRAPVVAAPVPAVSGWNALGLAGVLLPAAVRGLRRRTG